MNIISFNIWDLPLWFVRDRQERIVRVARYLAERNPEIICLQESFDPAHRLMLHRLLGERGYGTTDPDPQSRYTPLARLDTTGGLVIFSKFPILEHRFSPFFPLSPSPVECFSSKGMLAATLNTPCGLLRIATTHLHKKSFLFDHAIRIRQLKRIFAALSAYEPLPTVLAGDFNDDRLMQDSECRALLEKERFFHADEEARQYSYRKENPYADIWMNRVTQSKRLDYILYRDLNARPGECQMLYPDPALSDHDPVSFSLLHDQCSSHAHGAMAADGAVVFK